MKCQAEEPSCDNVAEWKLESWSIWYYCHGCYRDITAEMENVKITQLDVFTPY